MVVERLGKPLTSIMKIHKDKKLYPLDLLRVPSLPFGSILFWYLITIITSDKISIYYTFSTAINYK